MRNILINGKLEQVLSPSEQLQLIRDQYTHGVQQMKLARERCYKEMADAEELRLAVLSAASIIPSDMPDTVDLTKGIIVNGKFVERQPVPLSNAVKEVAVLTESFASARNKKQKSN